MILANSRPYEGLVFSLPVAAAMLLWLIGKRRPAFVISARRVVLPLFVVLLIGSRGHRILLLPRNRQSLPHGLSSKSRNLRDRPYFIWQTPRPEPVYRHTVMRDFYRGELGEFETNRTFTGYLRRGAEKLFPGGSSISVRF